MICAKCGQEKKRTELGFSLEDHKIYCMTHEMDLIPMNDTKTIAEHSDNKLVKKLLGKVISFRLTPDKVYQFAKMFQEQGHDTISGAVNALLDEHLEKHNGYEDVELGYIEFEGRRTKEEPRIIMNDFIAPKDEELRDKAEVLEEPEKPIVQKKIEIDIDDLDLDLDLDKPEDEDDNENNEEEFVI